MRICYIANAVSEHTQKWCEYFSNLGYEVHVISSHYHDIKNCKVHYIPYGLKNFPFMKSKVHKIISEINPDILHCHQVNDCALYGVTYKKMKVIVSALGSDILISPEKSKILKQMVKYILKRADFITSDSIYMTKKIIELGGNEENTYTFPMGIEDEVLNYRHTYSNDNKKIKIISTRRLEKLYNINIIIEGVALAIKNGLDISLEIAAGGSELENLKLLVKELNVSDRISFYGPYKPHLIGSLLENKDLFVSIPSSDATSVSLLEAMGCGIFPIVSDLPANGEWVTDRETGYILKDITPEEVCKAIEWSVKNWDKVVEASEKNISLIKEKALWRNNVKIVEDIYKKVLK
ncbi:MAG: glycosyltransferase family 4 protein [Clostridiales bacterium]|nr:glycosyltransferase family 4 protein [Clostridiales bacterium]